MQSIPSLCPARRIYNFAFTAGPMLTFSSGTLSITLPASSTSRGIGADRCALWSYPTMIARPPPTRFFCLQRWERREKTGMSGGRVTEGEGRD